MKKIYFSLLFLFTLFIIHSCSDSGTPTETTPVYQLSVTANPAEGGSVSPASGEYDSGDQVQVTATANEGWMFDSWQGDHSGSDNPATITMNSDKSITALFIARQYPLTIDIQGEGTVSETIIQTKTTNYEEGVLVELNAVPADGWVFSRWEGDITGSDNPAQITIDAEKNVTAVFERRNYDLTVTVEGEGSVSEQVIQAKTTQYPYETLVELTATPATGWVFDRWEGDLTGNTNPAQISIDAAKQVTAVFVRDYFALTTQVQGNGSIGETLVSGNQNESGYEFESVVELTATPDEGWTFVRWEGDITGSDNPTQITIDAEKNVTAVFERRNYDLTVTVEGEGSVSEQVIQAKTTQYPYETLVELTATPATGWVFDRWEGDLTGNANPAQISIDAAKQVTAVFVRDYFALTTQVQGSGSVGETLISGNQNETGYEFESIVELTATPATGWVFDRWEGDLTGNANPSQISIDAAKQVTAVFVRDYFALTTQVQGSGSIGETLVSGNQNEAGYEFESVVELTATPDEGWTFVSWEGDITGSDNPIQITVDSEKNVTAVFEEIIFTVDLTINGSGVSNINVISGTQRDGGYIFGSELELVVEPSTGWNFVHWEGDITGTENPKNVTISGNISATAVLDESPFAGGNGSSLYPYEVETIAQLQEVRNYNKSHFIQVASIDAGQTLTWNAGAGFRPIGDNSITFEGVYDGNGLQISNLFIDRDESYVGLFGYILNANIKNVNLINADITGGLFTGSVVGWSENSVIEYSTATGGVTGSFSAGGLVGYNFFNAVIRESSANVVVTATNNTAGGLVGHNLAYISQSYAEGNVTANSTLGTGSAGGLAGINTVQIELSFATGDVNAQIGAGGLVGENSGDIKFSYSNSSVAGDSEVGGLTGTNTNEGTIESSYSSGQVVGSSDTGGFSGVSGGVILKSYWDTDNSGQINALGAGTSSGITGLATSEMTGSSAQTNLTEFDWTNIWITTDGYPILRWQAE